MKRTLFLALAVTVLCGPLTAAELDWPTFRHDPGRTGRAAGFGDIQGPTVAWRHAVGGRRALIELSSREGKVDLLVPLGKNLAPDKVGTVLAEWDGARRILDLAGDGKLKSVKESSNVRYAKFLPGAQGYQKFVMEDGMSVKQRPDGSRKPIARGSLYRYDHGREELVWQTGPEEQCEIPLCAVADMDGDGALDIAISTWWRVMVFDGATGRKKMECRWHKGRNYGHFQLANLAGSPFPKCVVLADFMIHLDALDNDGKQLSLKWRREVDFKLFQKRKAVRIGPHPVIDLLGQGPGQIALNIFNDTGDNRWHVVVLDAASGETLADLPDRFLHGTADLGRDGRSDLLLSEAHGLATPVVGRLSVGCWREGRLSEEPVHDASRWLTFEETRLPQTQASCAADGNRTVLVTDLDRNGCAEAWVQTPDGTIRALEQDAQRAWHEVASCKLSADARVSVAGVNAQRDGLLLELDWPAARDETLALTSMSGVVRCVLPRPLPPEVPTVGRMQPDRPPVITVAAAGQIIALLAPDKPGDAPRELWRRPGRSQTTNMERFNGLEMADLDGHAGLEVLAADRTAGGQAALVAYDADGRRCWSHTFERFAGSDPFWNTGGLLLWTTGQFLRAKETSVFAALRRTAMHTDESCVVGNRSDREAWWQDNLLERGCGGAPVAVLDDVGDGRDDIIGAYPDILYKLSGQTGQALSAAPFPQKELGGGVYYATPTVFDADGDGKCETLLGRCTYSLALFSNAGGALWHSDFLDGTVSAPALADVNADGKLEIGAAAYRGGFRCYDAATGKVRWSLPAVKLSGDPVAADIDGDQREEFIVPASKELLAISETDGKPRIKWKLALPATAHSPIAADVDGDGRIEILCLAADGFLYGIRNAGRQP